MSRRPTVPRLNLIWDWEKERKSARVVEKLLLPQNESVHIVKLRVLEIRERGVCFRTFLYFKNKNKKQR